MTRGEIERGLQALGLRRGDIVLLHSSLASFGNVEGGADAVVDAFLNVLGEEGTLVTPIFGALGVITEVVRARPNAVRSIHPAAAVAAIGRHAEEICRDHWKAETSHGADTPYVRIAELGGYVCLAGVDQDRNTTLHTVEAMLRLPYLRPITRIFPTPEGEVSKTWPYFPGPHRDFIGLDRALRERGVVRMGRIGNSVIRLMKSKELIDACLEMGRADPAFVLCDNPNCEDCVEQRAAIRRAQLARETFIPAAAAGLGGAYVPEIVDTLRAAGLGHVELDRLEGLPIQMHLASRIERAVAEFREGGLQVIALRCSAAGEETAEVIHAASMSAVGRVIVPLSAWASRDLDKAREKGIRLSFCSGDAGSACVSDMLSQLRRPSDPCGFTFNAAAFARAGEKPFLYSYKKKLRRFVDQLDLEDCMFDGSPRPLGRGNAEIKEMISILRCAAFAGPMVLTSANGRVGSLRDAMDAFERLLRNM